LGLHVRFHEVAVLFFQVVNCIESCVLARRTAEVSICDDGIFLGYQTTGPFPG